MAARRCRPATTPPATGTPAEVAAIGATTLIAPPPCRGRRRRARSCPQHRRESRTPRHSSRAGRAAHATTIASARARTAATPPARRAGIGSRRASRRRGSRRSPRRGWRRAQQRGRVISARAASRRRRRAGSRGRARPPRRCGPRARRDGTRPRAAARRGPPRRAPSARSSISRSPRWTWPSRRPSSVGAKPGRRPSSRVRPTSWTSAAASSRSARRRGWSCAVSRQSVATPTVCSSRPPA